MIKKLLTVPPVVIDGTLYVSMAMFGAIEVAFTSDDAYKYVNVYTIFWVKTLCGILLASASALKMFRSTSYSDHLKAKQDAGNDNVNQQVDKPKLPSQKY